MVIDNRAHPRFETRLKGRLLALDRRCNYNCTILDVSEGGARVCTEEFGLVPNRVFLFLAKSGDFFECEVRWRRQGEVGLRLIDGVHGAMKKTLVGLCAVEPFL